MARAKIPKTRVKNARTEPYRKSAKDTAIERPGEDIDKENASPDEGPSETIVPPADKAVSKGKEPTTDKASADLPDSYLDIVLEEAKGEVPCYEDVRLPASSQTLTLLTCPGRNHKAQAERAAR